MHVRVYRRMNWELGFFYVGKLPINQRLIWLGPIFIHVAWGESARLVRRENA